MKLNKWNIVLQLCLKQNLKLFKCQNFLVNFGVIYKVFRTDSLTVWYLPAEIKTILSRVDFSISVGVVIAFSEADAF